MASRKPFTSSVRKQSTAVPSRPAMPSSGGSHSNEPRRVKPESGTNIQVVVRVRGNASVQSPSLSTDGANGQTLVIAPNTPNEQAFCFDHVFGEDADQGMIMDAIGPLLNDVLQGFNCTVFAYGPTGTGKTHTMQGDLSPNMGTFAHNAGVIPRSLYRLFHKLGEAKTEEFDVRATYLELYNEELCDLLALGNKPKALQIFEENNSFVVKGAEEVHIVSAEEGLEVLRTGSTKRHVAATNLNQHSSRSHCIFTLTICNTHLAANGDKETRIGKINLVDLAGSENVGRSGAQGGTAIETGNINKSLLALGNVISALTDPKASHIPYRGSKLTCLLRESLGGSAKTCIIATVAADSANVEQTISTLNYALRAKDIKNKLQANSNVSRNALINSYVDQIVRQRKDLQAARTGEGFYISHDNWKHTKAEVESAKTTIEELRKGNQLTESSLATAQEQFEQNKVSLLKTQAENKVLKENNAQLASQLEHSRHIEHEERVLREVHQQSEVKLDKVARLLLDQNRQMASELDNLHSKLERKQTTEVCNRSLATECHQSLSSMTGALEARTIEFRTAHERFSSNLTEQLNQFLARQEDELTENSAYIATRLEVVGDAFESVRSLQDSSQAHLKSVVKTVDGTMAELSSALGKHRLALRKCYEALSQLVQRENAHAMESTSASLSSIVQLASALTSAAQTHVSENERRLDAMHAVVQRKADADTESLQASVRQLETLLQVEREKGEAEFATITKLVEAAKARRNDSLTDAFDVVAGGLSKRQAAISSFAKDYSAHHDHLVEAGKQHLACAAQHEEKVDRLADIATETVKLRAERVAHLLGETEAEQLATLKEERKEVQHRTASLGIAVADLREKTQASDQSQQAELNRLATVVSGSLSDAHGMLEAIHSNSADVTRATAHLVATHHSTATSFSTTLSKGLSGAREESRTYLLHKLKADKPTGTTPQKRQVQHMHQLKWDLVPSERCAALAQHTRFVQEVEGSVESGAEQPMQECEEAKERLEYIPLKRAEATSTLQHSRSTVNNNNNTDGPFRPVSNNISIGSSSAPKAASLKRTHGAFTSGEALGKVPTGASSILAPRTKRTKH